MTESRCFKSRGCKVVDRCTSCGLWLLETTDFLLGYVAPYLSSTGLWSLTLHIQVAQIPWQVRSQFSLLWEVIPLNRS